MNQFNLTERGGGKNGEDIFRVRLETERNADAYLTAGPLGRVNPWPSLALPSSILPLADTDPLTHSLADFVSHFAVRPKSFLPRQQFERAAIDAIYVTAS